MSADDARPDILGPEPGWFPEWVTESGISAVTLAGFGLDANGRIVDQEQATSALNRSASPEAAAARLAAADRLWAEMAPDLNHIKATLGRAQADATELAAQRGRVQAERDRAAIDEPVRNDWFSSRLTARSTERLPQAQAEEPESEEGG